jgi:hypothetical protein
MQKTILALTLFSFTFLSLNVHMHEHDHAEHADHSRDYNTVEEDCDFCQINSEESLTGKSTISATFSFKNIIFKQYIANYISFNLFCLLNKSPPQ